VYITHTSTTTTTTNTTTTNTTTTTILAGLSVYVCVCVCNLIQSSSRLHERDGWMVLPRTRGSHSLPLAGLVTTLSSGSTSGTTTDAYALCGLLLHASATAWRTRSGSRCGTM